ncbi:DNA primase [Candidatus Parcubacteria bacterium]|nr:DNA primase [Candidatus Parcubacteria bacterium]
MDAVSEVKARLSIEDVISEYVRLKRAGKNFKGLSPFSNEKTPSFVVSPEKQIWHDFSSGRGGDIFTFIQEVEGVDFKGALELLSRKAGVDLEDYRKGSDNRSRFDKERLYKALDMSAKFYQRQLKDSNQALEYIIKKRGFAKQTVLDFQLGYSSENQRGLTDYLLQKGFSEQELKLCGLVSTARGLNDMFRGRLMIPLHDQFGKVIGFTARILNEQLSGPKYINTPSTPLYDKSRHIYGLHLAKQGIRTKDYSVIVEGNLDVIASHQAGQNQIVATAGTALTEYQMKALSRLSPNVRLSFDQDKAGLEAAERAIPIASKAGVNLSIITLSSGKDPDELIKKDPKLWTEAIDNADYAVDWLINRYKEKLNISTAQGKREFSDVMINLIKTLEDPVEQDHYVNVVSQEAAVDPSAIRQKLFTDGKSIDEKLKQISRPANTLDQNSQHQINRIDKFLSLSLMQPDIRHYLDLLSPDMLITDEQVKLLKFLKENPEFDPSAADKKPEDATQAEDYVKILVLLFEQLYASVDAQELHYEAQRLRAETIKYFVEQQKANLFALQHQSDEAEQTKILSSVRELDKLLSQTKRID